MNAVVYCGIGDVRLEKVPRPKIKDAHDAIVEITARAIYGTDLHFLRGTVSGMKAGFLGTKRWWTGLWTSAFLFTC